jgi:hypothetical protein
MLRVNDIKERLLRLDEDASLLLNDENKYRCFIVGGGALVLMGYISRATHDIDVINHVPRDLISLMEKYDISTNVSAHIDCFPDDYDYRATKIDIKTQKIDFYTLSLEDLVISKLSASRDKDIHDITENAVLQALNWSLLDKLAKDIRQSLLSDREIDEFNGHYRDFVGRYKNATANF